MMFCDFQNKIKKLNPNLWVDVNHEVRIHHKDFPHAGLYNGENFIMGVPHNLVPEYTIVAVNTLKLALEGYPIGSFNGMSGQFIDHSYIEQIREENPNAIEEKILAKGYRAILAELTKRQLINKRKAEFSFGLGIEEQRSVFPRRYLDLTYLEA